MTTLGNDAGDDFGKSVQEGGKSMNRFLGDEFGTCEGDEYGNCFSPGFSGLQY